MADTYIINGGFEYADHQELQVITEPSKKFSLLGILQKSCMHSIVHKEKSVNSIMNYPAHPSHWKVYKTVLPILWRQISTNK